MTQHIIAVRDDNHAVHITVAAPLQAFEFESLSAPPTEDQLRCFDGCNAEAGMFAGETSFGVQRADRFDAYALTWQLNARTGDPAAMRAAAARAFAVLLAAAGLKPGQGLRGHVYTEFEGAMWETNALAAERARRAQAAAAAEAPAEPGAAPGPAEA